MKFESELNDIFGVKNKNIASNSAVAY